MRTGGKEMEKKNMINTCVNLMRRTPFSHPLTNIKLTNQIFSFTQTRAHLYIYVTGRSHVSRCINGYSLEKIIIFYL